MADEMVLKAQKWVNSTYQGVSGYNACPENGKTGWSTMYSLIRGLQHELGITTLSDTFGPTTLAKLTEHGGFADSEENTNIIKIVQSAFFCKGYHAGDIDGYQGSATFSAIEDMQSDMGLEGASGGYMPPKAVKALLTMDAYVLVSGGTDKVRGIQRWLNLRYWQKSTFYFIPCDGIYSRDVQTALMKAIQYEIGIPEDSATGNFGSGTQAGLRAHPLSAGSTGIFVELFSAAAVFNGPAWYKTSEGEDATREASSTSTYDDQLQSYIRAFQEFSQLPKNGDGNYQTWAQLLVSMGDPDRAATACDTRFTITASRAAALKSAGYDCVGRYLDEEPSGTLNKEIQPGELSDIFGAGMRCFPIFQYGARVLADFSYSSGYQHGLKAHERGKYYGFNRGTVIYFAVDYDATDPEITSNILPYFYGVRSALASQGGHYVPGVYGSRNVSGRVTNEAYVRWAFVSGMSWGFSGNLGFPLPKNWAFNQIKEFQFTAGSDTFDLDRVVHKTGADFGVSSVNAASTPTDDFISYIAELYRLAQAYGSGDPNLAVMDFVRHEEYNDIQWKALIGTADAGFISYAKSNGMSVRSSFVDSFTGTELGAEHLLATMCGHYKSVQPGGNLTNRGDVAGWGGDLATFYGEWRRDAGEYADGRSYCAARLAKPDVLSSFGYSDLIEDADGYLIAKAVKGGKDIVTAFRDHYVYGGNLTRFKRYYSERFHGSSQGVVDVSYNMLAQQDDSLIIAGITYLINSTGGYPTVAPGALAYAKLELYLLGFADAVQERVGSENRLRAAYVARHGDPR
ncbi:glycoside hydrolase domain-containing protein [Streptomyces sp. NPDC048275]|uniref:glycoside hydrolase domain-containing protein n=1 Tax=Streptomyces sp. NPDC048275 TaxID=3155629 RepID=UPI0033CD507E